MRKFCILLAVILVLVSALATTAFAYEPGPEGGWTSTICIYGFTCQPIEKDSSDTWDFVQIHAWDLEFAGHDYGYLYATPKTTSGTTMGGRTKCNNDVSARSSIDSRYDDYSTIKLRIDHPAPGTGNNMKSKGFFTGYIE